MKIKKQVQNVRYLIERRRPGLRLKEQITSIEEQVAAFFNCWAEGACKNRVNEERRLAIVGKPGAHIAYKSEPGETLANQISVTVR